MLDVTDSIETLRNQLKAHLFNIHDPSHDGQYNLQHKILKNQLTSESYSTWTQDEDYINYMLTQDLSKEDYVYNTPQAV